MRYFRQFDRDSNQVLTMDHTLRYQAVLLRGGCSTVVECMDHDREGVSLIPAISLSPLSSVFLNRPLKESQHVWLLWPKRCLAMQVGAKNLDRQRLSPQNLSFQNFILTIFYLGYINHKRTQTGSSESYGTVSFRVLLLYGAAKLAPTRLYRDQQGCTFLKLWVKGSLVSKCAQS